MSGHSGHVAVLVSVTAALLLFVLILLCCMRRRSRRKQSNASLLNEKTPVIQAPKTPAYTLHPVTLNALSPTKPFNNPGPSPRPSPRPRRKVPGAVLYKDQELKLDVVFLDNQDEVVVAVRSGRNFPADKDSFVRVTLSRDALPHPSLLSVRETRVMRGMVAPRWGERLSFTGVGVGDLEDLVLVVSAFIRSPGGKTLVGFVELSLDSLHDTGRTQWERVISHEGIVPQNHRLAVKAPK